MLYNEGAPNSLPKKNKSTIGPFEEFPLGPFFSGPHRLTFHFWVLATHKFASQKIASRPSDLSVAPRSICRPAAFGAKVGVRSWRTWRRRWGAWPSCRRRSCQLGLRSADAGAWGGGGNEQNPCRSFAWGSHFFHWLKKSCYFSLLVLEGIYHYWMFFPGDSTKWKIFVFQAELQT